MISIIVVTLNRTWPDGLDVSVFTRETLARANREATLLEREHVVPWMWRMSSLSGGALQRAGNLRAPEDLSKLRWTIDDARTIKCCVPSRPAWGRIALLRRDGEKFAILSRR